MALVKPKRSTWAANPRKAVAYLRVSTTREQQELGISAQRAAIESWAKREGVEVCVILEEEVSGGASLEKRPVLLQAISALGDHGAGLLVVQRLDRFSRDPFSAAMAELELVKFGARLVTTDGVGNGDDPGSRLLKDVALAAARFERSMIAARTRAALAVKKARGESTGTPPYGWRVGRDGKTLIPDDREQETAGRLRSLREKGSSYRQVQAAAAQMGLQSRAGRPFTLQAVFELTKFAESSPLSSTPSSTFGHRRAPSDRTLENTSTGLRPSASFAQARRGARDFAATRARQ